MVGTAVIAGEKVTFVLEVFWQPELSVTSTVYVPGVETVIGLIVAPVDHK